MDSIPQPNPIPTPPVQPTAPPQTVKSKKGIYTIVTFFVFLAIILFSPIPYYQAQDAICKMGQTCPTRGWNTQQSLFQNILSFMTDSDATKSVEITTLAPTPSPIPDSTANWETYTDPITGFTIKYPNDLEINNVYDEKIIGNPKILS